MSLAQVLSAYLALNLLVTVAFFSLKVAARIGTGRNESATLRLHYLVLSAVFILTLIHPLIPRKPIFEPTAKVWSAPSLETFSSDFKAAGRGGYLTFATRSGTTAL